MKTHESGTLAAMFLARLALGISKDFEDIKKYAFDDKIYKPDQKEVAIYQELFPLYQQLVNQIESSYTQIADFQKKHPEL